jgi:TIR domain
LGGKLFLRMNEADDGATLPLSVFICYRRSDAQDSAGRLYTELTNGFPDARIFLDVDEIPPGKDWREVIDGAVGQCDVLLAVIGRQWVRTKSRGEPRLVDPDDRLRREIQTALARGIDVIPVLVQGASLPKADELPDELRDLAYREAIAIRHESWRDDFGRLARTLNRIHRARDVRESSSDTVPDEGSKASKSRLVWLLPGALAAVAAAVVAAVVLFRLQPSPAPSGITDTESTGQTTDGDRARLLRPASIQASSTAPASRDAAGTRVTFEARNVMDSDEATAWRAPGRAVGETLTLTFDRPVRIVRVGLIPGYAKIDPVDGTDRVFQNYIIQRVRYDFGDGSSQTQDLRPVKRIQFVELENPVVTDQITFVILDTNDEADREYTAISEIEVYGNLA